MPDSGDAQEELLNELADEFAARQRAGERPRLEEFCERHPALADDIRSLFPALVELERAKADAGDDLAVEVTDAPPITNLGDFRLLREVGRGGMGVVYEAEQVSLGRRVAIKLLPASVFRDPIKRKRFEREARAAARLHHTNIVPVHGFGEHAGTPYYVMQFIPGLGLDAVIDELARSTGRVPEPTRLLTRAHTAMSVALALSLVGGGKVGPPGNAAASPTPAEPERPAPSDRGPSSSLTTSCIILPGQSGSGVSNSTGKRATYWESVARIGVQVGGALAYAHKLGVLHRDVKPANLMLDLDGVVWVTDFGLAKADDSDNLTHTGDLLGTLRYMPPEAFEGKSDARSDVYALGLTLFELVALRPAYDEHDRNKLIKQVTAGGPPSLRKLRKDAPRDLVTVVEKAIDRDPTRRYPAAEELTSDLQRFLDDQPIKARRQTQLERCVRWARHHPGIAILGGVLTAVLVLATVASLLAARHFNRMQLNEAQAARNEREARHEAELSREAESVARQRAQTERIRADVTLTDMLTSRGLLAGDRDAPAEAALWFAAAAGQAVIAEDARREADNRLRARNWLRQAVLPVAALSLPGELHQFEFHPRRDLLLVRFDNEQIILWSWREDRRLPWAEAVAGVCSAQFSPDGATVALGFRSGEVQLRKVADGEPLATIRPQGSINTLAFSPNGKLLALAGQIVRVWDLERGVFLNSSWRHPQPVTALVFNRTGDRLITVCRDGKARVFAVRGGAAREEPVCPPMPHMLASAPALVDGDRVLVTVSDKSEVTRWNLETGKPAAPPYRTQPEGLQGIAASSDGHWFAAGGYNSSELHAADARRLPVVLRHKNLVRQVAFSPDSTVLLSVSWDQTARLWSLPHGRPLGPPLNHMANVEQCAWSPDGQHFVTAQNDGLIRVWRRPADDSLIAREPNWGQRPCISFDGRLASPGIWHESPIGGKNDTRLRVVATASGRAVGADITLPGLLVDSCITGDNLAVVAIWSHDGKGRLGVWDVPTAQARFEPITLPGPPISVAPRPGSGQLAVLCTTGDLLVIDGTTGARVHTLRHDGWAATPSGRNIQVQYTPDGKALVSLGGNTPHTVNVRDADSGRLRFAPLRSGVATSNFHSFAVSADSRLLATTALVKNAAQVWDLATGQPLSEPLPHPGDFWGLFSVRFSPDGQHLITSHKDGQVRYWDWHTGMLACPPLAHDHETRDAAITPDGHFALTVISGRPEVHIWELTTGRRVASPISVGTAEQGSGTRLAITPDGRRALVSLFHPATRNELSVLDLESLLSPSRKPTADLAILAELATARHITLGDLSGLTTEQWLDRWKQLRERFPDPDRALLGGK